MNNYVKSALFLLIVSNQVFCGIENWLPDISSRLETQEDYVAREAGKKVVEGVITPSCKPTNPCRVLKVEPGE